MTNKYYLFLALLFFTINAYSQSPWVNKKGSFYGQVSTTYLTYGSIVGENLNQIQEADFRTTDITASLYSDYSITDDLAVLVSLPYKSVRVNNVSLSSLGDPSIKLKYQILKNIPLSGFIGYTAPLSKREGILRTGFNQHAADFGLSVGKGGKKSFTYGGLGYRYRSSIPNQVLLEFEYGYRFTLLSNPFYLMLHTDGVLSTAAVEDSEAGQAKLYHNDGEFLSLAVKLSYNVFDQFWINLAAHSAVLVRNFGAASTVNIGLAYNIVK